MVRPKIKNGRQIHLYLSEEIISLIEKYQKKLSMSEFVERAILTVVKGCSRDIELYQNLKEGQNKLKVLQEENEKLKKEKERLEKKIQKLEIEIQSWKDRWGGQKTLDKYSKTANWKKSLAMKISEHIEEGKTFKEVMEEIGILDPEGQIDFLHDLFNEYNSISERYFFSPYLPEWRLVKNRNDLLGGYRSYIFKREEDGHAQGKTPRMGVMKNA